MFIISERINGQFISVGKAIDNRDSKFIQELALKQVDSGAQALDVNVGPGRDNGPEDMTWLVSTVQEVTEVPLCIDAFGPKTMEAGVKACNNPIIMNSTNADPARIGIIGICGWGGLALNAAALDTRIKATVAVTMYNMSRVNANGYFDAADSEKARYETRRKLNEQRTKEYAQGFYEQGGGVVDPLPADAPQFVKDYYDYYKTPRGYHKRSGNSNDGWTVTGTMSFLNQPILAYSKEIRSAVLLVHGENAHSRYFSEDAYRDMSSYTNYRGNKELLIVPGASHTDLYDGGGKNAIPFDGIESFFRKNLK